MNFWSEERISVLTTAWSEGNSASAIARRLGGGATRSMVCGKAWRLGLSRHQRTPARPASNGWKAAAKRRKSKPKKPKVVPGTTSAFYRFGETKTARSAMVGPPTPLPPTIELFIPLNERKTLAMLGDNDCRWPIGDPAEAGFHFCAKTRVPGQSYCGHHVVRAYKPPTVGNVSTGRLVVRHVADPAQRLDAEPVAVLETVSD